MSLVKQILMQRDGMTGDEAHALIIETRNAIRARHYEIYAADDVLMEMLGLEPDYLLDVIFYNEKGGLIR